MAYGTLFMYLCRCFRPGRCRRNPRCKGVHDTALESCVDSFSRQRKPNATYFFFGTQRFRTHIGDVAHTTADIRNIMLLATTKAIRGLAQALKNVFLPPPLNDYFMSLRNNQKIGLTLAGLR